MDLAKELVHLACSVKRQFERLSDNSSDAAQMLARLDSVTSLCRLIGASGEKRLWEGLQADISTLRGAVERAGAIAGEALPLATFRPCVVRWSGLAPSRGRRCRLPATRGG
jgi:hypothetical protein